MTDSITEIPEVGVQLPKWRVTLHLYIHVTACTGVRKRLHALPSHPTLSTAAEVAGNTALVCMTACTCVGKRLHALPSRATLGEPKGFS